MSQTYALDPVIRFVAPEEAAPRTTAEKVIMIDAEKRVVVPRKRIWSWSDVRYYIVSNTNDPANVAKGVISDLRLQDFEHSVGVELKYEVRCRPGNESRVALALFDPSAPVMMLERHFRKSLTDLAGDGVPAFVQACMEDRGAIEREIVQRAAGNTGLDAQVKLALEGEGSLNPITVTSAQIIEQEKKSRFMVTVSDFQDEEQELTFRMILGIDERNRAAAVLHSGQFETVRLRAADELRRYIRQNVTMAMFSSELNTPSVRDPLARHISTELARYGRRVELLTLDGGESQGQAHYQGKVDVICNLHEYPTPVVIASKVQMLLTDIARYKAAKSPPLEPWLRDKLTRYVPQLLFEARYIDVLLDFDPFETAIKETLVAQAAMIGCSIKQFITVPDLEPLKLREAFTIEVEESFATRLADLMVRLQLVVTARIPRLQDIRDILNRDQYVPRLMKESVVKVVAQYLHKIEPERFYMRFNFTNRPEEKTVESELVSIITDQLTREFHADVIDVVPKVVDTELITRLKRLQETISPFSVPVASLHGNEPVVFNGHFQVEAVQEDGWYKFQLFKNGIEEIREHLEQHLLAELQPYPIEAILYRNPSHRRQLTDYMAELAEKCAGEKFGLAIRVDSIWRESTEQERLVIQHELEQTQATLTLANAQLQREVRKQLTRGDEGEAQLAKLRQRVTLLTGLEGTEEEIADLKRTIGEMEGEPEVEIQPLSAVRAKVLPQRARRASLKEYTKIVTVVDDASSAEQTTAGDSE